MNTVNVDSLIEVMATKDSSLRQSFLSIHDVGFEYGKQNNFEMDELNCLFVLFNQIHKKLSNPQRSGFILGYKIRNKLSEEFDVLRFSKESILNIELKKELPEKGLEEIRIQLVRHAYFLSILQKPVRVFSFLKDTFSLYTLNHQNELITCSFDSLIENIEEDFISNDILRDVNMDSLLISPYSNPERFSARQYFLTSDQIEARKKILDTEKNKVCLHGGPGTGKTLVLVDVAKQFKEEGKRVLIIFSSKMNDDEEKNISKYLDIEFRTIKNKPYQLQSKYDVILVDEAQRMRAEEFESFCKLTETKVVFSVDHEQTLHPAEHNLNIKQKLLSMPSNNVFEVSLGDKIRTNPEMSSFIRKFLKLNEKNVQPFHYNNVNVIYFETKNKAKDYINNMIINKNFISIEQTPYIDRYVDKYGKYNKYRETIHSDSLHTHDVLGREYDNILVTIDEHFFYDDYANLRSKYSEGYPYIEKQQIFQSLTRVKNKLTLVIINNPKIYTTVQEILKWKEKIDYDEKNKKVKLS